MRGLSVVTRWSTSMQSLVVHTLAMRQLGRMNSHHHLAALYGLQQAEWCPRTIHIRQLCGCATMSTLRCHRPALRYRDGVRCWPVHRVRFKSSKKKGLVQRAEEEEEEEDDEEDSEDSDYEAEENSDLPKDYKDMEKHVQSFRYDVIMKAGLDMARNKIEDAFYNNKLRLNGQRLIKKSKTVKVGDTLDLVLLENQERNTVTVMRVILRRVFDESSTTDKYKVALRRWKRVELQKDEALKP